MGRLNHPFVVWASCFLWLTSMFSVTWALVLFICVGDMLILTKTDFVNAIVLLSGIIMIPTNFHMLYIIANGERVLPSAKVLCCPLWLCLIWIIIINGIGVVVCVQKIYKCGTITLNSLNTSMDNYRTMVRYKRFIDNLQWSLKCCGINSYKDWFKHDWCDKVRDYEWNPVSKRSIIDRKLDHVIDSVPLSCCKSGSCISNFLLELGTHSIHTKGCNDPIFYIIMISMNCHLVLFILIIMMELLVLKYIYKSCATSQVKVRVKNLMPVNKHFEVQSSVSSTDFMDEPNLLQPIAVRSAYNRRHCNDDCPMTKDGLNPCTCIGSP